MSACGCDSFSYGYLAGNVIRFELLYFKDVVGEPSPYDREPADPTEVWISVGKKCETPVVIPAVRDDVGVYHADWDTTGLSGVYYAVSQATGLIVAARQIQIRIQGSPFECPTY